MDKYSIIYSLKIFLICLVFFAFVISISFIFSELNFNNSYHIGASLSVSADVIVDAGHGGRDGGAVSSDGVFEKDLNLELSLTLREFLTFCGYDCILTRQEDKLVCDETDPLLKGKVKMTDLKNRLKIAEDNENAVFISIHMNKFPIEKYKGLQVYYSVNNNESQQLAEEIEMKTRMLLQPENNRKSKKAGSNIYILDRITIPAVLVECGFLSNSEDTALLSSEEYRAKLALVIAESIFAIKDNN